MITGLDHADPAEERDNASRLEAEGDSSPKGDPRRELGKKLSSRKKRAGSSEECRGEKGGEAGGDVSGALEKRFEQR